jgi:hypothetical protein
MQVNLQKERLNVSCSIFISVVLDPTKLVYENIMNA